MSTSNCVSIVRKNLARKTITYVLYTTITVRTILLTGGLSHVLKVDSARLASFSS